MALRWSHFIFPDSANCLCRSDCSWVCQWALVDGNCWFFRLLIAYSPFGNSPSWESTPEIGIAQAASILVRFSSSLFRKGDSTIVGGLGIGGALAIADTKAVARFTGHAVSIFGRAMHRLRCRNDRWRYSEWILNEKRTLAVCSGDAV